MTIMNINRSRFILYATALLLIAFLYACGEGLINNRCAKGKFDNVTGLSFVDNKTICKKDNNTVDDDDGTGDGGGGGTGGGIGDGGITNPPTTGDGTIIISPVKSSVYFGRGLLPADEKRVYDELQKNTVDFTENKDGGISHYAYSYLKAMGVNIIRPAGTNQGDNLNKIVNYLAGDDMRLYILPSPVPRFDDKTFYRCNNNKSWCYDKVMTRIPYYYTKVQYADELRQIKQETDKILAPITPDMTDLQKVKIIYDGFLRLVSYGQLKGSEGNIKGAFIIKKVVCEGYSAGLVYLLQLVDIPAIQIFGDTKPKSNTAPNGKHAWVKLQIDGKWYNADPTWDDGSGVGSPYVRYENFLLSDATFFSAKLGHLTEKFSGDASSIGFKITLPVAPADHPLTGLGINRTDSFNK